MSGRGDLARLRVPNHVFDRICAGPADDESMSLLRRGQYGIRLLRLKTLIESMSGQRFAAGDLDEAWTVLADAESTAPAVVEELLMHPAVGVWLARTLHDIYAEAAPAQEEVQALHAVAAAAAVRCRLSCTLSVPVVQGAVTLPTVGQWRLDEQPLPAGRVELRIAAGDVTFGPRASFVTAKRHSAKAQGQLLEVAFDDVDPHREFSAPAPPNPLDEAAFDEWCTQLDEAWDILTRWHADYASELSAGLTTLIPLATETPVFAASSVNAFGGVALSPKQSATDLAEAMVHEIQHSKLNALMDLLSLHREDDHTWFYAPWRDDPRPLGGILHGIYAFTSVAEFWDVQRGLVPPAQARRGHFAFAFRCRQVREAIDAVRESAELTELGTRFLAASSARLAALDPASVPADLADAITTLLADHRATWRIHHVRPNAADVTAAADAWTLGGPRPAVVRREVVPVAQQAESSRAALVKLRALDPESFRRIDSGESADVRFAGGDLDSAAATYERLVLAEPLDHDAWVGLGLAAGSRALLDQPETVRAVHLQVLARTGVAAAPLDLAAWLARA
ncbi:HEXXH motif domain-containing protein [Lentzea sp. NPDC005914]|uniref:HEXXH motif domain-containing protein n=1 Tax=Lentzea sp. NPDC005914 TaxID=3154572 RepID=UPI0033E95727